MAHHQRRYYAMGADAVPVVVTKVAPTVSSTATGVIHLALSPVKWGLHTAGGIVRWLGNTVDSISYKL
jgi:hypothetical protein